MSDLPTRETSPLVLMRSAVNILMEYEGQDRTLVVEMADTMLWHLITTGHLAAIRDYVARYCTVIDGEGDIDKIAGTIMTSAPEFDKD